MIQKTVSLSDPGEEEDRAKQTLVRLPFLFVQHFPAPQLPILEYT